MWMGKSIEDWRQDLGLAPVLGVCSRGRTLNESWIIHMLTLSKEIGHNWRWCMW